MLHPAEISTPLFATPNRLDATPLMGASEAVREPAPELPPEAAPGLPSASELLALEPVSPAEIEAALKNLIGAQGQSPPVRAAEWRAALGAVQSFYAARQFRPVWSNGALIRKGARKAQYRIENATEDGLDVAEFAPRAAAGLSAPEARAAFDVKLSVAALAYAMQASGGRLLKGRLAEVVAARPTIVEPGAALALIAAAADPGAALQAFNPPQAGYKALREALAHMRAQAAIARPPVRIAMNSAAGKRDFIGLGLAERPSAAAPQEAIILANMEMWRWEPRDMGAIRIEVNIPDFSLKMMDGDAVLERTRVIVGKPATPTPIFSDAMRYLLLNPSWQVPESIIKKEMLPRLAKDPAYFERTGFVVKGEGEKIVVRQPPGEANALGRIVFMFPNDHAVYLHDTPSRGLFALTQRALSHGCVRVEQPMRLGELVLGGAAAGWSLQRLQGMVGGGERTVFLARQIPIHLEYFTAFVDEAGVLQFRTDIYGVARLVARTLGLKSQG